MKLLQFLIVSLQSVFPVYRPFQTIGLFVVIKLIFWFIFINQAGQFGFNVEHGVIISNDYSELLGPVDNCYETGLYERVAGSGVPYAGRLPGYSAPYLILRSILPKSVALPGLILLQILLMAWATYATGRMLMWKTKSAAAFYIIAFPLLFLGFWIPWEFWTYPESLALSCFLIGISYSNIYFENPKNRLMLWAGFFFAWMFFLRGFLAMYLLVPPLILLLTAKRDNRSIGKVVRLTFLFAIPFIMMESAWITRNYLATGNFIPLQTSFVSEDEHDKNYDLNTVYKPSMLKLRELIACWGGDNVHFYPGSDMSFFTDPNVDPDSFVFPGYAYTSNADKNAFVHLRELVQQSFDRSLPDSTRIRADEEVELLSVMYKKSYKRQKPVSYFIIGPMNRLKNLLVNNVTSNWPGPSFGQSGMLYKGWRGMILLVYFGSMLFAVLALIMQVRNKKAGRFELSLLSCLLLLCLTFVFIFNTSEFKYFMTGSVILMIYSSQYLRQLLSLRGFNRKIKP